MLGGLLSSSTVMARILTYAMMVTTLVAIVVALLAASLAWSSMRRVADLQQALLESRSSASTCRVGLERADAQLDMVQTLFDVARPSGEPRALGGK